MAINENTAHKNRNTLYLARSGGGKSQALGQNSEIPKKGVRVLLWDTSHDHKCDHFSNRSDFVDAVIRGLRSGRGFRLAFSGNGTPKNFDWFCEVVWQVLDGNHLTYVIVEELSAVCVSSAKASPAAAKLLNQMRKYGGVFHGTTQKPTEIAKTFYDQSEVVHIGLQRGSVVNRISFDTGIPVDELKALKELEFWCVDPLKNGGEPYKYAVKYKEIS